LKQIELGSTSTGYLVRCHSRTINLSLLGLQSCIGGALETPQVQSPQSTRHHMDEVESPFKKRNNKTLSHGDVECQSPFKQGDVNPST
jgi:hypothetical protein